MFCRRLLPVGSLGILTAMMACAPQPNYSSSLYSGASYTGASSSSPEPKSPWEAKCSNDRFSDKTSCELSLSFVQDHHPVVAGSLYSNDMGKSWSISAAPPPIAFELRVGKNPTIAGPCTGPANSCPINGAKALALTRELKTADTVSIRIITVRGILDLDRQADGFADAMAKAQGELASKSRAKRWAGPGGTQTSLALGPVGIP